MDNWYYNGGMGISYDPSWETYQQFESDIITTLGLPVGNKNCLGRIDRAGDWTLNNVRWYTRKELSYNRRDNDRVTYKKQTRPLKEWAEHFNIPYATAWSRYNSYGWSFEEAMEIKKRG